ncbi:ABC transporter substrate-binding protein (plasmid) [Sinorhizobium medicae]|uniref:ABC transporter substrate-binding protein n=1 Tax=Sinorhizobium medicae TaxID=110321 RepID=UPI002AF6B5B1|nr:ABC transporter substrate-binding protein [Sinorhizobium medicae]WQO62168.1 ABC transporter substrate-binding protein [Sinorhizobium medicae]
MKIKARNFILVAALLLPPASLAAQPHEIPENLKGNGEVIIATYGGAWEAAQKKAYFDPFTRDTGINVVTVTPESSMLLSSVKLGQPGADIDSINGGDFPSWINHGALENIDYSYFAPETLKAIPEKLRNDYGIGAVIFSVNVAYNTKKFPEDGQHPRNWSDLFNVKDFPGRRALPKCESMMNGGLLEAALMGDGVPAAKLYPLDVDRAFAKLRSFRPNVGRWWTSGADAPQSLIDGEVDVAAAFNGRVTTAKNEGAPLALSWDQSLLQHDKWVVLKGAPNKGNAFKFLAYILRAEPQAAFTKEIPYSPVNTDAFKLLPKELAAILPGSPDVVKAQVFQNYEWWSEKGADGRTNSDVVLERCIAELAQ